MMRLDDEESRARLAAAEAEAGLRKRQRDAEPSTCGREDVTKGEDNVLLRRARGHRRALRARRGACRQAPRRGHRAAARRRPPPPGESAGARRARAPQLCPGAGEGEPAVAEPVRVGADRGPRQRGARRLAARQDAHPYAARGQRAAAQRQEGRDRGAVARAPAGRRRRHVERARQGRGRRRRRLQDQGRAEGVRALDQLSGPRLRRHRRRSGADHGDPAHLRARSAPSFRHRGAGNDHQPRRQGAAAARHARRGLRAPPIADTTPRAAQRLGHFTGIPRRASKSSRAFFVAAFQPRFSRRRGSPPTAG